MHDVDAPGDWLLKGGGDEWRIVQRGPVFQNKVRLAVARDESEPVRKHRGTFGPARHYGRPKSVRVFTEFSGYCTVSRYGLPLFGSTQ